MADITVTTDFSQLVAMNNEVKSTDTLFVKVVDSILREVKRANRVTKALADTTEQNLKIINAAEQITAAKVQEAATKREKARQREAAQAEKETQRVIAATNKKAAAEAKAAQVQASNKAETAFALGKQRYEEETRALEELNRAKEAAASREDMLRQKYDESYRAMTIYKTQIRELNEALSVGALTQNGYKERVDQLNQSLANGTITARNYTAQASTGMNKFGVAAQQTGYQVSDFIVQVQGGTNPLVAFSQQATQMAGLLYLLPPALQSSRIALLGFSISLATAFAAVTILIPLLAMLAMAFYSSAKKAKEAADGPMKEAEERVKSLDSTLKEFLVTRKAAAMGVTVDELISSESLDQAKTKLKETEDAYKKVAGIGQFRGIGAVQALNPSDDPEVKAAQDARTAAAERVRRIEERMAVVYSEQRNELVQNYQLELARLKLGEDNFEFKQLQAEADKRSYEDQLRSNGELNAQTITGLLTIYQAQQDILKARQSELVVTQNQRAADDARGKERLAAEQEYQAAIDRTVAKNQYWSEQAKAAERQRVAVEYIVNNLSLLGAKKDAEGFNKAMEDALAAGVQFSLVDLSSIVRIAASNGWDLAASIQAAYSAATQRAPAAASVLVGGGGRPEVGIDRNAIAGAEALMVQKRRKETEAATKGGGGGGGEPTESMLEKLQKQLDMEKELLGTTETYQRVRSALGEEFVNTSPMIVEGLMQQATEIENLTRLEEERQSLMDSVNGTLETGFLAMVKGTQTVEEAFRTMAAAIIEELFRVLVVKKLVEGVTNIFGGGKTFTNVAGLTGGMRASGGSMMAGQSYLVGEQGPEIVVPRHSGTVVNANQTASAMAGSGGFTQNLSINVTGSDAAMVRQEVAKMIPQITNATKAAVIDAKQRGGQMAAAFR